MLVECGMVRKSGVSVNIKRQCWGVVTEV
jgi:hypothetical protein